MLFVVLTLALLTSGCTKTVYVDVPVYVNVPVKCIVKDVHCEPSGTDAEVVIGLVECIIDMKQEAKLCAE